MAESGDEKPPGTGGALIDRQALKQQLIRTGHSVPAKTAAREYFGMRGNFAIALDATGSMDPLLDQARNSIEIIMNRVFAEAATRVKMQLFIYRDYDVPQHVLERSPLSGDPMELVRWLAGISAFGGGINPGEAMNEALQAIHIADMFDGVIVAGDEPSLPRIHLNELGKHQLRTAYDWAGEFGRRGIPIHTFVVGERGDTMLDFKIIAEKSGGQTGLLDGSATMIDMAVMAILARLKGSASVRTYMANHRLTDGARAFGRLLLAPPASDRA